MSAIVIGESMIEVIKGDDETVHRPGGAMLSTSIGLARLGRHVRFITDFGIDYDGDVIATHLDQHGVQPVVREAEERDKATMVSYVARVGTGLAPFSYDNITFDIPNPPQTATEKLDLDLFAPRSVLFGSLASHIAPGAEKVFEWIKMLRERSTIFYDPNVRPTITPDLNLTREQVERSIALADIVKASEKDIMTLYGHAINFEDLARQWLDLGPSIVVITHGFQGSILYSKSGGMIALPALQQNVVDPSGGGDAYMAALIDCLARIALDTAARRDDLENISDTSLEMLGVFATAAASVTVGRQGAKMPTRDELMDQYQIYRSNPHVII